LSATDLAKMSVPLPAGRVREVLRAPNPALASRCDEADPTSKEVLQLAADLLATQAVSPGCVGLAANQIGVTLRVFSLDVSAHPRTRTSHGSFVLVNPVVESATRKDKVREGCMSVPDFTGDVRRPSRLVVRAFLPGSTEQVTLQTDAFEARAIQHEIDHLDGLLFLDRVVGAHAVFPRRHYL